MNTDGLRNFDAAAQHHPGVHPESAQMLIEETGAMSIAIDTLPLGHGISEDFTTHCAWLPTGRFDIENIAILGKFRVDARCATGLLECLVDALSVFDQLSISYVTRIEATPRDA